MCGVVKGSSYAWVHPLLRIHMKLIKLWCVHVDTLSWFPGENGREKLMGIIMWWDIKITNINLCSINLSVLWLIFNKDPVVKCRIANINTLHFWWLSALHDSYSALEGTKNHSIHDGNVTINDPCPCHCMPLREFPLTWDFNSTMENDIWLKSPFQGLTNANTTDVR